MTVRGSSSSARPFALLPCGRVSFAFVLLVAVLFVSLSPVFAAEPKRVMLLFSFGREFKPWSEYAKAIREELYRQTPWPLDITEHSLVSARFTGDDTEKPFVEYLRALYATHPPDVIISLGAPAAAFVQQYRRELFPNSPMVLTAVEQRRVRYSTLTQNDAVVPVHINYRAAIENILRVLPNTKRISIVVGTSPIEKFWRAEIAKESEPLEDLVEFRWYDDMSFEEILQDAASLPSGSAIFWELMLVDAAGEVHEGDAALSRLHDVASAPIFSYDDSFFGRDIVGGPLLSVADGSRQAAAVALRILGGENAGAIRAAPIEFAGPKFDWREMQRWGISERLLPPGSEVDFRAAGLWELYRWQLVTIIVIFLVQSALIARLLYERRKRRHAEVQARRRLSELAHMNRHATVGELSASIAHEINQPLGAILNNAEAATMLLASQSPDLLELSTIVNEIKRDDERASHVIQRLRVMLRNKEVFEQKEVDVNDLVDSVHRFLLTHASASNVYLDTALATDKLTVIGDHVQLQQVMLNLIMNGMEALNGAPNGFRHVISRTFADNGAVVVSVSDSGTGIPRDNLEALFEPFFTTKSNGIGMGLAISRSIVELHGGRIWAENRIDHGATFYMSLPAAKSAAMH